MTAVRGAFHPSSSVLVSLPPTMLRSGDPEAHLRYQIPNWPARRRLVFKHKHAYMTDTGTFCTHQSRCMAAILEANISDLQFQLPETADLSESLSSDGRIIITRDGKLHRPGNMKSEAEGKHSRLESYLGKELTKVQKTKAG